MKQFSCIMSCLFLCVLFLIHDGLKVKFHSLSWEQLTNLLVWASWADGVSSVVKLHLQANTDVATLK